MATVYKARLDGQVVALKVAHQGLSNFVKEEGAFLKARQLNHPHIIRILPTPLSDGSHEYTVKDPRTGCWYFAMEFMQGGDLGQWMQNQDRIPLSSSLRIMKQVGDALDAAHRAGIVHLDVKPSNILFRKNPRKNDLHAVLTDFGIARPKGRLASGQTLTVEYASPEQARRAQGEPVEVGKTSDIYSLAVIFYEMLTGHLPFEAQNDTAMLHHIVYESPDTAVSHLPAQVTPILKRALAKSPAERYPSARAFVTDLDQVPAEDEPAPSVTQSRQRGGLSPLVALGLGILVGLGIGGPTGYYFGSRGTPPPPVVTPEPTSTVAATTVVAPTSTSEIIATATLESTTEEAGTTEEEGMPTPTREATSTPIPATDTPLPRPTSPPTEETESPTDEPETER
jgi:serine/threonine-protein kinase